PGTNPATFGIAWAYCRCLTTHTVTPKSIRSATIPNPASALAIRLGLIPRSVRSKVSRGFFQVNQSLGGPPDQGDRSSPEQPVLPQIGPGCQCLSRRGQRSTSATSTARKQWNAWKARYQNNLIRGWLDGIASVPSIQLPVRRAPESWHRRFARDPDPRGLP